MTPTFLFFMYKATFTSMNERRGFGEVGGWGMAAWRGEGGGAMGPGGGE